MKHDSEPESANVGPSREESGLLPHVKPDPCPLVEQDRGIDPEWAGKASVGFYVEFACAVLGVGAALFGFATTNRVAAASVAVLCYGLGSLMASLARRYAVKARTRETGMAEVGGVSTEYLVGGPAVILGVLSLMGIVPTVLNGLAALVFGVILMFAGTEVGRQAGISTLYPSPNPPEPRVEFVLQCVTGIQIQNSTPSTSLFRLPCACWWDRTIRSRHHRSLPQEPGNVDWVIQRRSLRATHALQSAT